MSREQQTSNNDQSYDQGLLQTIRQQICLNNHQLLQLTYNDQKFKQKLKELNHLGCQSILQLKYHQALIYLNEAQKVLQYAASCGKTIERTLIITTLNNQASLYQRAWELQKAASYIQAIIYNISQFFQKQQQFQFTQMIFDQNSVEYQSFRIYLWRKKILAIYYLQFCAVNSQNKKHQNAYNSAAKAILLLKQICNDCYKYQKYINTHKSDEQTNINKNKNKVQRNILKQLYNLKPLSRSQTNFQSLFTKAITCIGVYMKRSQHPSSQQQSSSQQLKLKFSTYSIGHLMQINPFELQKDSDKIDLNKQISLVQKIFKSVYVSIGHFILATELRFISTEKYTFDQNQRKNSTQYKQSQNYHLYSIIIAAKFLPCNSVYFQHIVNSFKNHYKIDLIQNVKEYLQNNHNPIDQDQFYQQQQSNQQKKQVQIFQKEEIKIKVNYQSNQKIVKQNNSIHEIQVKQQQDHNNNFDIKTQKSQEIKQDIKQQQIIQDIPSNETKSTKKHKKTQSSAKKSNNLTASKKNLKRPQSKHTSTHTKRLSTTGNQNFIRISNNQKPSQSHYQLANPSSCQKQNKLKPLINRSSKSKKKQSLHHFNNNNNNNNNNNIKSNPNKKSQTQNIFRKNNNRQNSTKRQKRDSDYDVQMGKSRSKSKRISTNFNGDNQKISFKKQKQLQEIRKNRKVQEQYGINMELNTERQNKNNNKIKKKTKEKSKSKSKNKSVEKSIKFTSPQLKLRKLKSPKNLKKVA